MSNRRDRSEGREGCGPRAARLELLFNHMLEGYAYCRMLFDENGKPEDLIYLDVNPAFSRLTGLEDVVNRRITEVIPGIKEDNPEVLETYGRVVLTGETEEFETFVAGLGVLLKIVAFRPEPDHFVAVFEDITERRRAQKFLEARINERTDELAEAMGLPGLSRRGRE